MSGTVKSATILQMESVRRNVNLSERKFDVEVLPADLLRVYRSLESRFGEEYALLFVFNMQTAMELHRAWHMTLLTSKIMQRVKDTFGLRMTWNLGVIKLKIRVEDGGFELHRRVPYDYDSEYQDLFMRIAYALCEGHLTVHEALLFQQETKQGLHTAPSGRFLRGFPGRLMLYPALSSTCAVIFFGGDWGDAGVAAICGIATGLIEYALTTIGGEATVLVDLAVGMITGVIGGLFYRFDGGRYCLSSIFLGTLYWYFYGTAFVIGLLEIIAGELETGVTRFMAVSIKTFVLCIMASFGLLITLEKPADVWIEQNQENGQCVDNIDLETKWWRILLYLACSAAALGQYRFRVVEYWRGLIVQLVAYEVQYQVATHFVKRSKSEFDNLDTMISNIMGAACAVVSACILSYLVDAVNKRYYGQLLQRGKHRDETISRCDDFLYNFVATKIKFFYVLGLGRGAEREKLRLEKKLWVHTKELNDPNNPRQEIILDTNEENLLLDTIVNAESMNIWAMLMPAVYQLVPGSMIAKLWFDFIFPQAEGAVSEVFSNLMVISLSLALGLIVGFAVVQTFVTIYSSIAFWESEETKDDRQKNNDLRAGMYTATTDANDDPTVNDKGEASVERDAEEVR